MVKGTKVHKPEIIVKPTFGNGLRELKAFDSSFAHSTSVLVNFCARPRI